MPAQKRRDAVAAQSGQCRQKGDRRPDIVPEDGVPVLAAGVRHTAPVNGPSFICLNAEKPMRHFIFQC